MALGLSIIALAVLMAVFAPLIASHDPQALDPLNRLKPPAANAYFGTDTVGRDVFSRTIFGSRLSLAIGASVTFLTMLAGVVIGISAGYYKLADNIVMRFMDGLMAFPSFLLAIALVALLGASFQNVVIAISVVETPRVARIVRGSVLSLRERQYVEGAIAVGAKPLRILATHIFPNLVAPLTVQATYVFALAILVEAGLSFLGAGVPPYIPSWGNMMGESEVVHAAGRMDDILPRVVPVADGAGGESALETGCGIRWIRGCVGRVRSSVHRMTGCWCDSTLFDIPALCLQKGMLCGNDDMHHTSLPLLVR